MTTANKTDREGAVETAIRSKEALSEVKNLLVDGGYTGEKFATQIKDILDATVEVAKRSELHKFVVLPA